MVDKLSVKEYEDPFKEYSNTFVPLRVLMTLKFHYVPGKYNNTLNSVIKSAN